MKKLALFPLIIVALSCGKEINTPTESSKNVFGNWKLHLLSGGFSGGIHEINEETTLELKPNGRATYTVGKKKTNCSFKLDISSTIHGSNQLTMSTSKTICSSKEHTIIQTHPDTLNVLPDCYDCFSYQFVKQ